MAIDTTQSMLRRIGRDRDRHGGRGRGVALLAFGFTVLSLVVPHGPALAQSAAGGGTSACAAPDAEATRNALRIGNRLLPLRRGGAGRAIAYTLDGSRLTALDATGRKLWEKTPGEGQLFGTFDLDRDGWPDVGVARHRSTGKSCGRSVVNETWLELYAGRNGALIASTSPMEDMCHTALNYASPRWAVNTVISGGTIAALAPQYGSTGWFYQLQRGRIAQHAYLLPNTQAFTNLYPRADAFPTDKNGNRLEVIEDSHVQNGVIMGPAGRERLVFFTSGRVLQYAVGPLSANQLVADRAFKGRGPSGRNYGTVAVDTQSGDRVALVAGTNAMSVAADMIQGKAGADDWGGIERHVTVYQLKPNDVTQRYFGSAHDDGDRGRYQNRIVSPGHILLPSTGGASHIAFNRFADGHWTFHITKPGSPGDSLRIPDVFVWDIRDLDGDGTPEVIASPTPPASTKRIAGTDRMTEADRMAGYLPMWTTRIYTWDAARHLLRQRQEIADAIPWLEAAPVERGLHSSSGAIYPVLTGGEDGKSAIYLRKRGGGLIHVPLARDAGCVTAHTATTRVGAAQSKPRSARAAQKRSGG